MEHLLLSLHVLAGILFVGPVAVTTSIFPRFAPSTASEPTAPAPTGPAAQTQQNTAVATALFRITRTYGMLALAVPVIGLLLAAVQGRLTEVWVVVAMVLTAVAGALLSLRIAPMQREAIETPDNGSRLRTLRILTGLFNLLWAAVVVLMIVRPGAA